MLRLGAIHMKNEYLIALNALRCIWSISHTGITEAIISREKGTGWFGDTAFRLFFGNYVDLDKAYIHFYYYYERTSTWHVEMISTK